MAGSPVETSRALHDLAIVLLHVAEEARALDGRRGLLERRARTLRLGDQHIFALEFRVALEGPADKVFTCLRVAEHDELTIPTPPEGLDGLAYLGGQGFGTLLDAECRATRFALSAAGRPNAEITFPRIDAYHVGEWVMWMQIAIAYGGELYGVDAFDQPGVEGGKIATYGLMGREGFEDERARVEAAPMSDPRFVVG